ncbi:hypothetical protein C8E03_10339 [Lachnotalea glycerini]|uniref:Glycosyltransferase RgtA/B/C/D-like domain-containing protein n=1 Tax=Lachnotalea glycerini TaxID=1763509 RepID=A0A318EMZ4_9FIRM|nr:hypothetical protein [Lachnotalea glycerini]PXV91483.1 hypothetical protein C8E03_10339 [Lachnotalea glycerini]
MYQNMLEKLGIKFIAALLGVLMLITLICSILKLPDIVILDYKFIYLFMIELIGVFFFIAILRIIYKLIQSLKPKHEIILSVLCLFIITLGQLFVIKFLEIRPIEDLNKVTNMAIDLVNNKSFLSNNSYFSMYTNNIPFTIYLSKYFKICIQLGIRNYTLAGSILGIFAINTSLIITSLLLKELKNRKSAVFFLAFNVLNPVIYIWGTFFYTTIIAIPFMMLAIYLIVKLEKETRLSWFCMEIILFTIVLYIGTQIRATTCFVLIAAILLFILRLPGYIKNHQVHLSRQTVQKCLCAIILSSLCVLLLNTGYSKLKQECMQADYTDTQFPATHWIMMGLEGNGGFNWHDEQQTLTRPTKEAKLDYTEKQISNRLKELGLKGLAKLIIKKLDYTWSDGSHDYPVIMRACHNYTNIHKYIFGDKRDTVIILFQIFHIMTLLLLLLKIVLLLTNHTSSDSPLIYILLFGGVLFHLIWEANPKYSLNFMMLLFFIACEGLDDFLQLELLVHKIDHIIYRMSTLFILFTVIVSFLLFPLYTKQTFNYADMVQGQFVSNKDRLNDMYGDSYFSQTFFTNRAFNHITIRTFNGSAYLDASYQIKLLDESQNVLYETDFSPKTQNEVESIEFDFPKIIPDKACTYTIQITSNFVLPDHAISFCMSNKEGYDVFPYGNLFINNEELNADLAFTVKEKGNKTYTNTFPYLIFVCFILLSELFISIYGLKRLLPDKSLEPEKIAQN